MPIATQTNVSVPMRAWTGGAYCGACCVSVGWGNFGFIRKIFGFFLGQRRLQSLRAARECYVLLVADFSAVAD